MDRTFLPRIAEHRPLARVVCNREATRSLNQHLRGLRMSDELREELERLRAENAALKKTSAKGISMKVSEKGGLSIYGLGRFPITLYKEQGTKLIDMADDIRWFVKANGAQLKAKD